MTTHSKLSPSARHRWGACPGSVREEAKYPEQPSGPAAIDGTHTHTLLEKCIESGNNAEKYIGLVLKDHDGEFMVDAARAERVQFALDYVAKRKAELGDCEVIAERRVYPDSLVGRDDMSGTVDIQIHAADMVEIIDYKDGMNVVESDGNPQLEQYLVGVAAGLGALPRRYRMTIIQPKLRNKGLSGISIVEVPSLILSTVTDSLKAQGAATDAPDAPLIPGESQCKYCAHKGSCSALAGKAMADSGVVFANLGVAKQSADKDPHTMTDVQIVEILESAPLLRQLIEGVEVEAQRRLEAGQSIEGLKLVKGRGSRTWMFDDAEMAEKFRKMGVPKDAIYTTKLISPAQAEKVTWEKKGVKTSLSELQLKRLNNEYIKKSDGKLTVALATDDRPAVIVSAAGMFNPVEPSIPSWLL